jgi:transposase
MSIHRTYYGCDISKAEIEVFDPQAQRFFTLANEPLALERFAQSLKPDHDFVVFEATGGCDRLLRHALGAAGVAFCRFNPARVRRFAEATGRLAKTDRIDARLLAQMGAMLTPSAAPPPDDERERLAALVGRRDQLVELRAIQQRQAASAFDPVVLADIEGLIAELDERIATIEAEIARSASASSAMKADLERLRSAPGVGPVTATNLVALLPELGALSPKRIAALVGLAPFNDDSGPRSGRRHIRGGRGRVRRALYMAALGAVRSHDRFRAFYTKIAERSGSKKLAIIAAARKLLTVLNAMQRDKRAFA